MDISIIGDPHHEIRQDLKKRGWLDLFFNTDFGHLRNRKWASHPNGYYQPGVIALHKTGRVLYRWRCVPQYANMSGAGARPEASYTWEKINEALSRAEPPAEVPLDEKPVMGSKDLSWPRFLLVMTAHGWFLRPKAFPLVRDGGKDACSPKDAMRRWYVFVVAWALAFLLLPPVWVLAGLGIWMVALIPGLVEIHRQFQNEPDLI